MDGVEVGQGTFKSNITSLCSTCKETKTVYFYVKITFFAVLNERIRRLLYSRWVIYLLMK